MNDNECRFQNIKDNFKNFRSNQREKTDYLQRKSSPLAWRKDGIGIKHLVIFVTSYFFKK